MKERIRQLEKLAEIYAIARQREEASVHFYRNAAAAVADAEVRSLLLELAAMEEEHLAAMETRYQETARQLQALRASRRRGGE